MRNLIGLRLDEAIARVESDGDRYVIEHCDSDKLKEWDSEIIVKADIVEGVVTLVAARFLIDIN